jgi:hypothetical protein
MGKIKNKVFGLVVSKDITDSLADSIKEGNQAKFYLAQNYQATGKALDNVTLPDESKDRNVLIINGNRIQGVSQGDLYKLDAITNVTKLFKYKGSVETGAELLAKVPPEAEVGDVWNVQQECIIDGVRYPAYTNFICSSIGGGLEGKPSFATWDSLGGTMQIGTTADCYGQDDATLLYHSVDTTPITRFYLRVSTEEGLCISTLDKKISLKFGSTNDTFFDNIDGYYHGMTCERRPNTIIDSISIRVDSPLFISTKTGKITLNIGTGLTHDMYAVSISLSRDKSTRIENGIYAANSGLAYNQNGELTIAIGEPHSNNDDCIDNALVLGTGKSEIDHGGLCISSNAMVNFINKNISIRNYINSLIDAKLKAQ